MSKRVSLLARVMLEQPWPSSYAERVGLGKILLVSEENELPYHRPPLSKELLAGKRRWMRFACARRNYSLTMKLN